MGVFGSESKLAQTVQGKQLRSYPVKTTTISGLVACIVSAESERHTSECANEQQLVCLGQSQVHYTSKRKFACMLDFVNKQARLDHAQEDNDDPKCWPTNCHR